MDTMAVHLRTARRFHRSVSRWKRRSRRGRAARQAPAARRDRLRLRRAPRGIRRPHGAARSPKLAGEGPRARDRHGLAPAAARRGAGQRRADARPRLRRHARRRRHPPHGEHVPGRARHAAQRGASGARARSPRTSPASKPARASRAVAKGGFHQVGFHPTGVVGAFARSARRRPPDEALAAAPRRRAGHRAVARERQPAVPRGRLLDQAHASGLGCAVRHHRGRARARTTFPAPREAYEGRFGLYRSHLPPARARGLRFLARHRRPRRAHGRSTTSR